MTQPKEWLEEDFADVRYLTNREIVAETASMVSEDAVLSSRGRGPGRAFYRASALYKEALRRGNSDLYQRGYNEAVCGYGHSRMMTPVATALNVGEEMREVPDDPGEKR